MIQMFKVRLRKGHVVSECKWTIFFDDVVPTTLLLTASHTMWRTRFRLQIFYFGYSQVTSTHLYYQSI